jgi:hypothetical protein
MLRSVFPRAHQKYFSLPLLGPISDGLDNWLAASGFTQGSRKLSLNLLPIVDRKLHRLGIRRDREAQPRGHRQLLQGPEEEVSLPCGNRPHAAAIPGRQRPDRGLPPSCRSAIEFERRVCRAPLRSSRIRSLHGFPAIGGPRIVFSSTSKKPALP